MPEFIFMLTHEDVTVENALEVHGEIRDVGLRYVGFKDIGLPFDRLKALTKVIHESGQEVMLEVVSEGKRDELRSAQASLDLGVDYLLGGTHAEEVAEILAGSGIRYCPFPGRVVGHPSQLRGSIEEITESARRLAAMEGVSGLDLLAYRYDGDVSALVRSVVGAVDVPVIAAGSMNSLGLHGGQRHIRRKVRSRRLVARAGAGGVGSKPPGCILKLLPLIDTARASAIQRETHCGDIGPKR